MKKKPTEIKYTLLPINKTIINSKTANNNKDK